MRSETVHRLVFWVSGLVFIVQDVGYWTPGWFVHEVAVPENSRTFHADNREFTLPCFSQLSSDPAPTRVPRMRRQAEGKKTVKTKIPLKTDKGRSTMPSVVEVVSTKWETGIKSGSEGQQKTV